MNFCPPCKKPGAWRRKSAHTRSCRGGRLCPPAGRNAFSKIHGESVCAYPFPRFWLGQTRFDPPRNVELARKGEYYYEKNHYPCTGALPGGHAAHDLRLGGLSCQTDQSGGRAEPSRPVPRNGQGLFARSPAEPQPEHHPHPAYARRGCRGGKGRLSAHVQGRAAVGRQICRLRL